MTEAYLGLLAMGLGFVIAQIFKREMQNPGLRAARIIKKAKKSNSWIEGKLTDTSLRKGDGHSRCSYYKHNVMTATYQYDVQGKQFYKKIQFIEKGDINKYPTTVTMYYNPKHPKIAACPEELGITIESRASKYASMFVFVASSGIVLNLLLSLARLPL